MSEGNGASAGTPSNGNGSAAATAPAPGVAPGLSPKSGEGAVVPKEAPPKWQPLKTKLKYGNGEEEEVEIDSEETLQRRLLNAKGFDRANKKALDLERQQAALKDAISKKDYSKLKDLGFDPEAFFVEKLQSELRREQMSEADRAKEDHEARVKAAETRAQAAERRAQAIEAQVAEEKEWASLHPRLGASMREAGMLDDTFAWQEVSSVAQEFLDQNLDVPPETVVKEAAARDKKKFGERLGKVTREQAPTIWKQLSPEVRKAFGYMAAQEHIKAKSNIPAPSEPVPQQVQTEKQEQPASLNERAWLRKLNGIR